MKNSRIELRNVGKYYYSETAVTQALRKINLSFRMNEFVAITGESGSGKSTLLKLISGMDTYDEGEMFLDGEPTFQYDDDDWERYRRQEIGYVFQDYSLIGHYSARDNIVSALLIMGMEVSEARKKAEQYLERVGLREQMEQAASKLSSGQKQRLSIARALAKGTDIIVADEPTGNLDSETGEQIVRLLADLSRDHLVIMVTHNYEQVAPYVTRKVSLHDGELVSDVPVNQGSSDEGRTDAASLAGEDEDPEIHKTARLFTYLNIRTQAGKALLFTAFFLLVTTVSFLFIGQLLVNADDRISRTYDPSAFANEKMNRIAVRHPDNSPITEKDIEKLRQIRHVTSVDEYDCINDMNYYHRMNEDYMLLYGYSDEEYGSDGESVQFLDDSHFMRSSTCITKEDLVAGRMPEEMGEIVIYSREGKKALEQEKGIYLRNVNVWGKNEYIHRKFKVTGVLKEPEDQIYFSPEFCRMLTASMTCPEYDLHFFYVREEGKTVGQDDFVPLADESLGETADGGSDYLFQISENYIMPVDGFSLLPKSKEEAFGGQEDYLNIFHYDEEGKIEEEPLVLGAAGISSQDYHSSSGGFLLMSKKHFEELNNMENYQAAVYFTSYAKTDQVLDALGKSGFEGISTYQASVTEYDEEKVTERLTTIAIAFTVLLILFIAEVLILRSMMKIQIKDFFVMKFMGMKMKLMCRISYYEMGIYLAAAMLLTIIAMHVASRKVSRLHEMLYYYELPGYLLFAVYNLLAGLATVAAFNHLLKGRMDK